MIFNKRTDFLINLYTIYKGTDQHKVRKMFGSNKQIEHDNFFLPKTALLPQPKFVFCPIWIQLANMFPACIFASSVPMEKSNRKSATMHKVF